MKEKFKKQKGITLVALVITIIVLLILAMVSISIVMNQGIMTKSKDAADKYNEAAKNEQEELTFFEKLFGKYSDGNTVEDNTVSESPYVTPRTEVTYKGQTLKVGDYVNYDEGTGYTWDRDEEKTGTYEDSGCHAFINFETEDMNWRVLGLDTEGNLELISDKPTSKPLILAGKAGYLNGEEQLNEMCDTLYGKGTNAKSARSVNADDINEILGYNKRGYKEEYKEDENNWVKLTYGFKTTYKAKTSIGDWFKVNGSNEYTREGGYETFTNIDGTVATDEKPIIIENNGYWYGRAELEDKVDSNILEMTFGKGMGSGGNNDFLLASRYVKAYFGNACWGLFNINNGNLSENDLYYSDGDESNCYKYVRPVVTLKSDVQLSGNSTDGWTIN